MAKHSSFSRHEGSEGIVFDIVPATAAKMPLIFMGGLSGVFLLGALNVGSSMGGLAGATILGAPIGAFLWFSLWRIYFAESKLRKATSLAINSKGLQTGSRQFDLRDIAELSIRASRFLKNEVVSSHTVVVAGSHGAAIGAAAGDVASGAGKAAAAALAARAYRLELRTKQQSDTVILAGGLTLECAEALLNDVNVVLKEASMKAGPNEAV